jgi:hypothetical protein
MERDACIMTLQYKSWDSRRTIMSRNKKARTLLKFGIFEILQRRISEVAGPRLLSASESLISALALQAKEARVARVKSNPRKLWIAVAEIAEKA